MNGIEYLGWFATGILLVGYYLNAKQNISSWILWFIGNSLMTFYAYAIQSYSVVFLSIILVIMNVYGYLNWKKSNK